VPLTYDSIIERCAALAQSRDDIRGLIVLGSRARTDRPADEWSDLDLVIITTEPQRYLEDRGWLSAFGPYWAAFVERQATDTGYELRVLFDGALDVDFIPVPLEMMLMPADQWPPDVVTIFRRGYRIVLDKDDFSSRIAELFQLNPALSAITLPDEQQFLALWNDYFYHAVWVAKKLRRGELWTAKLSLDTGMKWQLLHLIEWHAKTQHGAEYDIWHNGRFLEKWADPRILEELRRAYAHYDERDLWQALFGSLDLYRWVAREVADHLSFTYPLDSDQQITHWIAQCRSDAGGSGSANR
jgi:aminoglycoside 6-adenylyltransferase